LKKSSFLVLLNLRETTPYNFSDKHMSEKDPYSEKRKNEAGGMKDNTSTPGDREDNQGSQGQMNRQNKTANTGDNDEEETESEEEQ
jgi:hypothetical protein